MNDFETIRKNWDDILKNMKEEHDILPVSFDTWLKPLRLFDFINSQLLILVPEEGYIKYLDKKYEYIARNEDASLYAYNTKPSKSYILWKPNLCEKYLCFDCFIIDFPMVKWSDSEPWLIEDLKKLEVVEGYE